MRRSFHSFAVAVSLQTLLVFSTSVQAHVEPEEDIEELTAQIAQRGELPELLIQRAIEYRVLGKLSEAAHDLEIASRQDPSSIFTKRELSRVYFAQGKTNEALTTLNQALKMTSTDDTEMAAVRSVRSDLYKARGEFKKALEDIDRAIRLHPGNVEWYLKRSELHERLKQSKRRISGLEEGIQITGGGILDAELVEAMIDDAQYPLALKRIEAELANSRVRSSWLIRRARARMGMGEKEGAKEDLHAAIDEINTRVISSSPDPSLLADRAQAHELLNEKDEARKDYEAARDAGADDWVKDKIKALKGEDDSEKDTK